MRQEEKLRKKDDQIRKAYTDVIAAVTGGKLVLMTGEEIRQELGEPVIEEVAVRGAEELATAVNRGRHLAISRNTTVCAQVSGTSVTLRTGGCAGTLFTGIGTTAAGLIALTSGMRASFASGTSVVFTNLGAASTAATLRVTHPTTGKTRDVVVSASGQVRVQ